MSEIVRHAHEHNPAVRKLGYKNWIEKMLSDRGYTSQKIGWDESLGTVLARVIRGNWTVECPGKPCGGAIIVDGEFPFHFCPDCLNADNKQRPQRVVFPGPEIERVLGQRDNPMTRNWIGESVVELVAENVAHGLSAEEEI